MPMRAHPGLGAESPEYESGFVRGLRVTELTDNRHEAPVDFLGDGTLPDTVPFGEDHGGKKDRGQAAGQNPDRHTPFPRKRE